MALSIDWGTKVITVLQSDLTFIGGTLYELDTETFRTDLKALEASEVGQTELDTHIHFTEYMISGVTYARAIQIINGYTVTFSPDASYRVNLVGSNNNISDVLNLNSVQVIPQNSAGLIKVTTVEPAPGTIVKNTAFPSFHFELVSNTDHVSPALSQTVTAERLRDAEGVYSNLDNNGSVSEIGTGTYEIDLTANDLNADVVTLRFTSTGSDQRKVTIVPAQETA